MSRNNCAIEIWVKKTQYQMSASWLPNTFSIHPVDLQWNLSLKASVQNPDINDHEYILIGPVIDMKSTRFVSARYN
jgi:hypothetical protein